MPRINHFTIKDSNIFIKDFNSKSFLYHKKDKKDYGFTDINIIFAYNGYWKSSFTALLKNKSWKKDILWNDYSSDIKDKKNLWKINLRWFLDKNKNEEIISNDNIKWKVIVFDKYFVEKNLYIPTYLWKSAEKKKNEKFKNKLLLLWTNIRNLFEEYQRLKENIDLLKKLSKEVTNTEEKIKEKSILERIKTKLTEQDEIELIDEYIENINSSIEKLNNLINENNVLLKYKIGNNIDLGLLKSDIVEKEKEFNNYLENIQVEQENISQDLEDINFYLDDLWFSHLKLSFKENIWWDEELTNAFVVLNKWKEIDLKQLSEWELKAIWLALFFTLLYKNQDKIKDCIIVFDDPVNSYDHKKRIKLSNFIKKFFDFDIKDKNISTVNQIFILTHDNLFYKFLNKNIKSNIKRVYMIDKSRNWSYFIKYNDKDIYGTYKKELKEFIDNLDNIKNDFNNIEATISTNLAKLRYIVEYAIKEKIFNESADWMSNILSWINWLRDKLVKLTDKQLKNLQDIYDFCSAGWLHQQDEVVSIEMLAEYINKFDKFNL